MRVFAALVVFAALLCPRSTTAQAGAPNASITYLTRLPKAATSDQVAAALVEAGYTVAEASPTVVRTERRTFQNIWDLQLRANILTVDSITTRVVITGVYWVTCCGMIKRDNVAVEESHRGVSGKMWEQLTLAADRVKQVLPPPGPVADSAKH